MAMLRNDVSILWRSAMRNTPVHPGRFTHVPLAEPVTVFLIGMRANRWWKVHKVLWTASKMASMIRHLVNEPEAGMLSFHQWFGRTTILVSYWRSPEHLMRFAADPQAPHVVPWRDFVSVVGHDGDIGIWHETYRVSPGDAEAVYTSMPIFGLAGAVGHEQVGPGSATAQARLGRRYGKSPG
ncbi:MAG: DUF4188 domain-containing protein [Propionibacteriaceae bacterium]|nr:DUF4188 domain-containing protein [Propionibacteriaceae bacterium]